MTDVTTTALPAPRPVRPRTTLVAALFVAAGALVGFFGLVALYVARRAQALNAGQDWFDADAVELGPPGFIFATLILSVFTVQWAVHATRHDDRVNAFWALAITGLFGAAVFNQLWFILAETGFSVDGGEAEFLFLVVNGYFAVMLIAAVATLAITFLRALAGQYTGKQNDGVAAAALFWNAVVAVWAVTWYVIYITK